MYPIGTLCLYNLSTKSNNSINQINFIMKKLSIFVFALFTVLIVSAQTSSDWKNGQDVTEHLMGDYDGSWSGTPNSDNGKYWKGSIPTEWEENEGIGVMGFYFDGKTSGELTDIYQIVKMPAGYYTIKVQALYREGTPYDSFQSFFAGMPKKNAHLYASILAGEDANSEVTRDFDKVIRSLASSEQTERLFFDSDGSWMNDASAQHPTETDEDGKPITYWCPCCLHGASCYFKEGKYWNEMDIILLEDAYVRIGIRKTASIAQDWIPFSNWHIIYNSAADEQAQMQFAKDDCINALSELDKVQDKVMKAGFNGFVGVIEDKKMEFDDAIYSANSLSELIALLADINNAIDKYNATLAFVNSLKELIEMSADMLASTEFPGLSAFTAAYNKAEADAKTDDVAALGDDPGAYFQGIYNELAKARADYLNTGDVDESGAKDFTALIKHPWFVNPEYTPSFINGAWQLTADGWTGGMNPGNYSDAKNGRTDIASKVTLSADETVTNQWYKYVNYSAGWSGGLNLYYQGYLIGVSDGWNSGLTGTQEIRQQLVGLPNGYYSLKGLVRGNGSGDWSDSNLPPYHNIFAQNSEEVVVKSLVGHTDSYIAPEYGWYEWQASAWQEHKTGIIQVNDGKLLIGGQTSMIGNFTGFRLMYYGENPSFNSMIQEEMDNVMALAEGLTFAGDIKYVNDCLAQIQQPISGPEAYEAALIPIREATEYITKAKAAKYTALDTYISLLNQYTTEDEQGILDPARIYAEVLGTRETDTYLLIADANAVAEKYGEYLEVYERAIALNDEAVNEILAKQTAELKAEYKNVATISEYLDNLALPYNLALFNAQGASEASEANPVDVSTIMVNPSFEEGPTKGWAGASPTTNDYAVGNAELWNSSTFTFSQKLVALPAGTYELRARALYRDATAVTPELVEKYNEAGGEENWANHNAQLFAKASDDNDQFSYIKAIHSLTKDAPSFIEGHFAPNEYDEETGEAIGWDKNYDINVSGENGNPSSMDAPAYPFDTKVGNYYYPASMYGFYSCCVKYPEAYTNSVRITIEAGETLEVGIRKTAAISEDWVIFDDFQLFYLSGDVFKGQLVGIIEVATPTIDKNVPVYNIAGQRLSTPQKGINIINGKKVYIK